MPEDFTSALAASGLGAALVANGRAPFTQEAADLAVAVSKRELISPSVIAFTHCCEHSFEISPSMPNVNGKPSSPWNFDVGPFQLNLQWTMRSIFQGEVKSEGLIFTEVFGSTFFETDGVTPCGFTGIPLANARMAARVLANRGRDEKTKAVKFTGPAHQEKRATLYDGLIPSFDKFFALYQS
jgi:hypothetical protein